MALLARPNWAALCLRRPHLFVFCNRTLVCVGETKGRFQSRSRLIEVSNEKLSSRRIGLMGAVSVVSRRSFCIHARTEVSDSGSMDFTLIQSMEKKIKKHLNAESVVVRDSYGDGRHVCIDVISAAFDGQSAVNRQRMVYKAIWEELQNTVHAVDQMTTRTPAEAALKK